MSHNRRRIRASLAIVSVVLAGLTFVAGPASSSHVSCESLVFEDTFDTENAGTPVLNFAGWTNWNVADGTVDLIGSGTGGTAHDFYPGNGLYVDLDGSSSNAGTFSTKAGLLDLAAGDYELTFELGGSTRGDTNTVAVTLAGAATHVSDSIVMASTDPLVELSYTFTLPAAESLTLTIENAGGDNLGAILDDVRVCATGGPAEEPPTLCGLLLVNHDEWTLSNSGFSIAPAGSAAAFAENVGELFAAGGSGNFLAYSANFGLTGSSIATTMTGAGHTWTVSTAVPFTAADLAAYDAVFVGGHVSGAYPDNTVLVDYINAGGNVYVMGGTGNGGAAAEAAGWNALLNTFGLSFASTYNGISGVLAPTSGHPLFDGVAGLYYDHGNSVSDLDLLDPSGGVLESSGDQGLFGLATADGCEAEPEEPPVEEPPLLPCPHSQGFWKNDADAWPLEELTLGTTLFSKGDAIGVLETPPKGDARLILAHQLIAAELNLAAGAVDVEVDGDGTLASEAIAHADQLLADHGGLLFEKADAVKSSSPEGSEMVSVAGVLDAFNNGAFTRGCSDVGVTKTTETPFMGPGQEAVFTIVVTNHGPGAQTGVTLEDTLPAGTWQVAEATGACPTEATGSFSCSFGTLASGETRTVTVSRFVEDSECTTAQFDLVNEASISVTGEDRNASNDAASATITVGCN